ncbi:MAG: 50S ribosome-binding GTPase [Candidatus Thorarchaeota archaeon]|nr:MAG: 50S ribosome-binding GTPase [Candidatus Thorarchaeota archaeon]
MSSSIKVALIGNPNVGKSVIFNNLTGSKQHTGNWPGKTVEKKEGFFDFEGYKFEVVDLPGVYSLSALSEDERVARQYLIDHRPDVVVDILNASQLERNLYLTLLLIELQVNLVIVLNMQDVVESKGDRIDAEALARRLKTPLVTTTATKKEGMDDLKRAILDAIPECRHDREHMPGDLNGGDDQHYHPRYHHHGEYERLRPATVRYSREIEVALGKIVRIISKDRELSERYPPRWIALRILENDPEILSLITDEEMRFLVSEVRL